MKEAYVMMLVSPVLLLVAFFAYQYPEKFLSGRRSKFWVDILGREGAIKLVKYFSVPLVVLIAIGIFIGGIAKL